MKLFTILKVVKIHDGESRDILHLYSDRTGKNTRHYFFHTQ